MTCFDSSSKLLALQVLILLIGFISLGNTQPTNQEQTPNRTHGVHNGQHANQQNVTFKVDPDLTQAMRKAAKDHSEFSLSESTETSDWFYEFKQEFSISKSEYEKGAKEWAKNEPHGNVAFKLNEKPPVKKLFSDHLITKNHIEESSLVTEMVYFAGHSLTAQTVIQKSNEVFRSQLPANMDISKMEVIVLRDYQNPEVHVYVLAVKLTQKTTQSTEPSELVNMLRQSKPDSFIKFFQG